jgi:hypothetical protein
MFNSRLQIIIKNQPALPLVDFHFNIYRQCFITFMFVIIDILLIVQKIGLLCVITKSFQMRLVAEILPHLKKYTIKLNYVMNCLPYLGVIIDGTENWVKSYNNSNKSKKSPKAPV